MYEIYVFPIHFSVVKAKVAGVPAVFEKYREYPLIERNVFKGTVRKQFIITTGLSRNCTF